MKLLKALTNWLRKKDDEAAQALKDPVSDGKFAIEDAKSKATKFRSAIARAMAANKGLEDQKKDADGNIEKWARIAKQAVKSGNDTDATDALTKKNQAEKQSSHLDSEIKKNNLFIEVQRKQLNKIEGVIQDAENDHDILAARMVGNEARVELAQSKTSLGDGGLSGLKDLKQAVEAKENEAEALEELAGTNKESLEEKYDEGNKNVSDELAKLKAELNK